MLESINDILLFNIIRKDIFKYLNEYLNNKSIVKNVFIVAILFLYDHSALSS
jgi:hypothetical protein